MALATKIIFWRNTTNGQVVMGMPEQFPAPPYFEKIVCGTVQEAERWSGIMRQQEAERDQIKDEEREEAEERMKSNLRSHIHAQIANARNSMNRDFLVKHLEAYDNRINRTKSKRESFLHAEGYERGR